MIRDVKYLTTLDQATAKYGERLLDHLRKLFGVIHRRNTMTPRRFEQALEQVRKNRVCARQASALDPRSAEHG